MASLLKQGTSPDKVALCLVLGAAISVFPVIGTTTVACTMAAALLRLNLPAIQAINWLFAGAQLVLLIPFMRIGEIIFRDPPLPLSAHRLAELGRSDPWFFLRSFWLSIVHAVTGWAVICMPLAFVTYKTLLRLLRTRRGTLITQSPDHKGVSH